jgi:hypothetical protein
MLFERYSLEVFLHLIESGLTHSTGPNRFIDTPGAVLSMENTVSTLPCGSVFVVPQMLSKPTGYHMRFGSGGGKEITFLGRSDSSKVGLLGGL